MEALATLKNHYGLALLTNIDQPFATEVVKQLPAEFQWILTAQQIGQYKPSPEMFRQALSEMDLQPHQLLHVGHSLSHDITPAKSLKITTAWVNRAPIKNKATPKGFAFIEPDIEVPDLTTLISLMP